MSTWSRGMIPASGAGGPEFDSRSGPVHCWCECFLAVTQIAQQLSENKLNIQPFFSRHNADTDLVSKLYCSAYRTLHHLYTSQVELKIFYRECCVVMTPRLLSVSTSPTNHRCIPSDSEIRYITCHFFSCNSINVHTDMTVLKTYCTVLY
mgnify:CR=1 FL=1